MKRFADITMICLTFTLILSAAIFTVMNFDETASYYENRKLTTSPDISIEDIKNGEFLKKLNFNTVEAWISDHAACRTMINKLVAFVDIKLIHRPVVNDVVITNDTLLPFNPYEIVNNDSISTLANQMASNLEKISDITESYGGSYYYVSVPCQYAYFEDRYPSYLNNRSEYTEKSLTALKSIMDEKSIQYLDIGDVFKHNGHPDKYSSAVDNHYSMYGAFAAYQAIMNKINEKRTEPLDILSENDLTFEPVNSYYMGSRTRKIFNCIKNNEHLYKLKPHKPVEFTRTNHGSVSAPEVYAATSSSEPVAYTLYMGGDLAETEIRTNRPDLPSVLIYGDSFTNALECIAYLSFDTMYSLDMRHYKDMTVSEYIMEKRPDYVICVRDYEALLSLEFNGLA